MEIILVLLAVLVVIVCIVLLLTGRLKGRGFADVTAEWDPPIIVDSILSLNECKYLIDKATPMFTRSGVVGMTVPDASRTSETAWIDKTDPVARKVFDKVLEKTGK
jgi:hypothetical protein